MLPPQRHRKSHGVAIVIVLVMVVMLSSVMVAFLSRTMSERHVSKASADSTGVELFALGTVESLVGDIRQEIAAGSITPFPTPSPGVSLFVPSAPVNAVPARVGSSNAAGYENLVKRSVYSEPFFSGSSYNASDYPASNRAANLSTLVPSRNGRVISPARWNKPLFLAKAIPADIDDLTPFGATPPTSSALGSWSQAPDWILVSRDAANPTVWNNNLRISPSADSTVIGRYAYMIYDQGGLLDVNAIGYPSVSTPEQYRYKSSLAFADLRQIPGFSDLSNPSGAVNALIGWRNYASSSSSGVPLSGDFPNYVWDAEAAKNYHHSSISNDGAFIDAGNRLVVQGQSDRLFSSRQQLITFLTQRLVTSSSEQANLQKALQYLTSFSRDLNQPSLHPIYSGSYANRLPVQDASQAGNSSFGNEESYNSPFLSVRVANAFTRNDGTSAVVGEPLVRKRFPLNRLAWITAKGPSASLPSNDPIRQFFISEAQLPPDFLDQGTPANIQKSFGLTWVQSGSFGRWVYDHGVSSDGIVIVGNLQQVNALNREPDFFELLKAAINVGSLAKSSGYSAGIPKAYATQRDIRVDLHILQIGANIIDQFDPDGFPTHLQLPDANGLVRNLFGRENLPYLNSVHLCPIAIKTDEPTGLHVLMDIPAIWNPIDLTSPFPTPGSFAPTFLRVSAVNSDPANTVTPSANRLATLATYEGTAKWCRTNWDSPDEVSLMFANVATLYREPTLLAQPGIPSGSQLSLGAGYKVTTRFESDPAKTWTTALTELEGEPQKGIIGFISAVLPSTSGTSSPQPFTSPTRKELTAGRTFRMEWAESNGGPWYPYAEYYNINPFSNIYGIAHPQPPLLSGWNSRRMWAEVMFDPRTPRFGSVRGQSSTTPTVPLVGEYQLETLQTTANVGGSGSNSTAQGFHSNEDARLLAAGWGTTVNFVYPGVAQINSPTAIFRNKSSGVGSQAYSDPDGVIRRAMAGYVPPGDNNVFAKTAIGLPLASNPASADSRPTILNRPFKNVGELGYVYRDTAWKNIDFFTVESGDGGLLDVFCIHDDGRPDAVVGGKVNLNTRHPIVLKAILSGIHRDEFGSRAAPTDAELANWANALVSRTTSTLVNQGPLTHLSDLVGRYVPGYQNTFSQPYDGFVGDLAAVGALNPNATIQRFREAPIRALSSVGTTRTWNFMIDIIAQTGRYPLSAQNLADFNVESERRFWVHIAIDRYTGEIIDQQIEPVKE